MYCPLVTSQFKRAASQWLTSARLLAWPLSPSSSVSKAAAKPAPESGVSGVESAARVPPPGIIDSPLNASAVPVWFYERYATSALLPSYPPREARPYSVTVVVPTRNEAPNLLPVLVAARPFADELLVIDGHSHDGSREIARACGARVLLDEGKGKGEAIRKAIHAAHGDVLVFLDADGSHDPSHIPALLQPIFDGHADHVSGSRMLGGSDELHATFNQFVRLTGSQIITLMINYTLNVRLTDCQNGFRAIRRDVAQKLELAENITTIEQEMVIKTLRWGYRMAEVATHEYGRANGESNFRVQDVWLRYLFSLLYYLYIWRPRPRYAACNAP